MSQGTVTVEALTKSVKVSIPPQTAFSRFTERMSSWWPLSEYSVGQEKSERVEFGSAEGEQIVEYAQGGAIHIWGTITKWEPGRRVEFTWHPGGEPTDASKVLIVFREIEGGTEIELIHTGWEVFGEKAMDLRSRYDSGWDFVLGRFADL